MLKTILRMIYPSSCVFCGKNLEFDKELEICEECYTKLDFFDEEDDEKVLYKKYYDKVFATFSYEGKIAEIIKEYKYKHKAYLFRIFAKLMFYNIKDEQIEADVILSVPLYPKREKARGYNQAHLIARNMSKLMGIKYYDKVLKRIKSTDSLALCNKEQRSKIIEGAFVIEDKSKICDKNVIIIDDVFTTGVTVNECSKVLKLNGAKSVVVIVLAKTK